MNSVNVPESPFDEVLFYVLRMQCEQDVALAPDELNVVMTQVHSGCYGGRWLCTKSGLDVYARLLKGGGI